MVSHVPPSLFHKRQLFAMSARTTARTARATTTQRVSSSTLPTSQPTVQPTSIVEATSQVFVLAAPTETQSIGPTSTAQASAQSGFNPSPQFYYVVGGAGALIVSLLCLAVYIFRKTAARPSQKFQDRKKYPDVEKRGQKEFSTLSTVKSAQTFSSGSSSNTKMAKSTLSSGSSQNTKRPGKPQIQPRMHAPRMQSHEEPRRPPMEPKRSNTPLREARFQPREPIKRIESKPPSDYSSVSRGYAQDRYEQSPKLYSPFSPMELSPREKSPRELSDLRDNRQMRDPRSNTRPLPSRQDTYRYSFESEESEEYDWQRRSVYPQRR
ncbi:hypothetical protein EDD86DRAFT_212962 [Gorgonomyces haynaldii]|nr:hypothetical protein EDD86DRAFT_212962 [Gorgonomyces haynaldii]